MQIRRAVDRSQTESMREYDQ